MHGPHEPHEPTVSDDATHLSTIALSALAAVVVTAGLVSLGAHTGPAHEVDEIPLALTLETTVVREVDVEAGADRLYGTVLTKSGDELEGYLRWQGREASWSDVLRATDPGGNALAGVRFGNVARIEPRGARNLDLTLKSGDVVRLNAIAQRAGAALRPMSVEFEGTLVEVPMHDLESVDFLPEPLDLEPIAERLHGTLITRSGLGFTGYIAWDLVELDASALLEGVQGAIPFAEIASITRSGDGEVLVARRDATEDRLSGTPELSESNRGIVVSDPLLGAVEVPWRQFRELRLHPAAQAARYEDFDGGRPLSGTVVTTSGEELTGFVKWDLDEESTWQMLDGSLDGMQFHVELSQVASVTKRRYGAKVELLDGRSFYLSASNDVNWSNKGIEVTTDGRTYQVGWRDFVEFVRH